MAWEPYLNELKKVGVEVAGLYGKNGACWAADPDFQCSPNEIVVLVDAMASRNENICGTGVSLAGKNWAVIRLEFDFDVIILKEKSQKPNCPKQNLVIALSNMALICGANKTEDVGSGIFRPGVERVRDYLKSQNY